MPLPAEFHIRLAVPADALCLGALATQVFFDTYATGGINAALAIEASEHHSAEVFASRLASQDVDILVAEVGGNMVGFADLQYNSNCPVPSITGPEVLRLYVQGPFQNQGLGRALLASAESRALAKGAHVVWLTAWVGNTRATAFYPRAGYEQAGTTAYFISGKAYENHVFAKRLSASGV